MKFAASLALKNVKRRIYRTLGLGALVMFLAFTLFAGAFTVTGLRNGLASYSARLGADIVVVPTSATSHGAVDDILLQGITGNYYMNGKTVTKICATEGIAGVTRQIFLTSAKASCCSVRVQIIGYEPETDFVITPWINESYNGTVSDGDVVVGSNITVPDDKTVTFYGQQYHVVAQLKQTGTGLDSAVYTNMNTIREMAANAASTLETTAFNGIDIDTAASAVYIKVADGYQISDVTDDINIHISKVEATAAGSMIADIADGLDSVAGIIGILVAAVWVLAAVVLIIAFMMISNERRKEFAVLRVMGASRGMLFEIIGCEAGFTGFAGGIVGLIVGLSVIYPVSNALSSSLELPLLTPSTSLTAVLCAGALILAVLAGLLAAFISARRLTAGETAFLLREDT